MSDACAGQTLENVQAHGVFDEPLGLGADSELEAALETDGPDDSASITVLSLAGCGNTGKNSKTRSDADLSDGNYTIGISQFAEHGSLDNCREGFLQGLADEGIVEGKNLTVSYDNAQANTIRETMA